jgi:hypothetical protein
VLYQKARAYDELGRTDEAIQTMERLIGSIPLPVIRRGGIQAR